MNKPRLQIIRGLPGSGKTSLALDRYSHLMRIETDMFFYRGRKYIFTADLNEKAVKWFNKTVRDVAKTGMDFVVTGVFAAHTERLADTINAGLAHGYEIYIKTLTHDYGNIHDVPKAHLDAMRQAFVSERKLREIYKTKGIHFGLMPRGFSVKTGPVREKPDKKAPSRHEICVKCGERIRRSQAVDFDIPKGGVHRYICPQCAEEEGML